MRQSSVFSVPSRAAVYEEDYRASCETSLKTSSPPRKVSKQCFYLFPKIREIDGLMTPDLESRIYEVHPELAFWRLNGEAELSMPKKVKSRANPSGLDLRRDLLVSKGLPKPFLDQKPPRGCGRDDLLDAAANSLIAEQIFNRQAEPFPENYQRDDKGLRMAIWA
jgi:predicted RNase H-like nuclease